MNLFEAYPALFEAIAQRRTAAHAVYLVGGAVRDMLRGESAHDLDFAVSGGAIALARRVADALGGNFFVLDEERDTGRVLWKTGDGELVVDFAALRASDLEGDLRGRDFTINAMALDAAAPDRLIDPLHGAQDLRDNVLRACSPDSFRDDPLRVLRAVRQSVGLHLRIEPATLRALKAEAPRLADCSAERRRDELFRMLEGSRVAVCVRLMDAVGALPAVLPELSGLKGVDQTAPHVYNVWEHTLATVQNLEALLGVLSGSYVEDSASGLMLGLAVMRLGRFRTKFEDHLQARALNPLRSERGLLFLAALYHDIGKPAALTVEPDGRTRFLDHDAIGAHMLSVRAQRLALSNPEVEQLVRVVRQHMRVHFLAREAGLPSSRSIYRFYRPVGEAGMDVCLLSLADMLATYGPNLTVDDWKRELDIVRVLMEGWFERAAEVVAPPRLVTGAELIAAFDLTPGPVVGRALDALQEAQAAGEVSDREQALVYVSSWLKYNQDRQEEKNGTTAG